MTPIRPRAEKPLTLETRFQFGITLRGHMGLTQEGLGDELGLAANTVLTKGIADKRPRYYS